MRKTPPTNSINGLISKCHSGARFCLAPACCSLGLLSPGPVLSPGPPVSWPRRVREEF